MGVDNIRVCPSCKKIASWSMYFQRYICPYCGWEGDETSYQLDITKKKKTNIEYAYCNSPEDISWWLGGHVKNGIGLHGFSYSHPWNSWEKLKDASQIISVSYDQSQDMYLVVFKVEEE